jgi:hypothetical protein
MHATHACKQIESGMHCLSQGFICRTSENDMVFILDLISSALLTNSLSPIVTLIACRVVNTMFGVMLILLQPAAS